MVHAVGPMVADRGRLAALSLPKPNRLWRTVIRTTTTARASRSKGFVSVTFSKPGALENGVAFASIVTESTVRSPNQIDTETSLMAWTVIAIARW